jgi:hypothetical protein
MLPGPAPYGQMNTSAVLNLFLPNLDNRFIRWDVKFTNIFDKCLGIIDSEFREYQCNVIKIQN